MKYDNAINSDRNAVFKNLVWIQFYRWTVRRWFQNRRNFWHHSIWIKPSEQWQCILKNSQKQNALDQQYIYTDLSSCFNDLDNFYNITPCFLWTTDIKQISTVHSHLQQAVKIFAATTNKLNKHIRSQQHRGLKSWEQEVAIFRPF